MGPVLSLLRRLRSRAIYGGGPLSPQVAFSG
jgi:hypothetical protein